MGGEDIELVTEFNEKLEESGEAVLTDCAEKGGPNFFIGRSQALFAGFVLRKIAQFMMEVISLAGIKFFFGDSLH